MQEGTMFAMVRDKPVGAVVLFALRSRHQINRTFMRWNVLYWH
jgi:hypothetical protein